MAGVVAGLPFAVHQRVGSGRFVVGALREDCGRGTLAGGDTFGSRLLEPRLRLRKILGQQLAEARSLRREHRDQRVVRGLRYRRVERRRARRRRYARVAPITAEDRVQRIEHGDVHDRHRTCRTARTQLLAELPSFTGLQRRMVEPTRVDRNLVPVAQRIRCLAEATRRPHAYHFADSRIEIETFAEEFALALRTGRILG